MPDTTTPSKKLPHAVGKHLHTWASRWLSTGETPIFYSFINMHSRFKYSAAYELNGESLEAAIASAIGDGYLAFPFPKAKNARIVWNMGNRDHAMYKRDFFQFLGCKYTEKDNPGFGENWYCSVTSCHPCFTKLMPIIFGDDGKVKITLKLLSKLDSVGWAWFYGDDGSLMSDRYAVLHTEGYGKSGSEIFAKAINKFLGIKCATIHKYFGGTPKKDRFCVKLNRAGSDELFKRIAPHMAHGVEYKIGKDFRDNCRGKFRGSV